MARSLVSGCERGSPKRIVLVEDHIDTREATAILLRMAGHSVVETANALSGLAAIEREVPDVALVDIGLPDLTGYEIARRVRAQASLASVLLVALTAYTSDTDIERAMAAGFDRHLGKPAELDVITHALSGEGVANFVVST